MATVGAALESPSECTTLLGPLLMLTKPADVCASSACQPRKPPPFAALLLKRLKAQTSTWSVYPIVLHAASTLGLLWKMPCVEEPVGRATAPAFSACKQFFERPATASSATLAASALARALSSSSAALRRFHVKVGTLRGLRVSSFCGFFVLRLSDVVLEPRARAGARRRRCCPPHLLELGALHGDDRLGLRVVLREFRQGGARVGVKPAASLSGPLCFLLSRPGVPCGLVRFLRFLLAAGAHALAARRLLHAGAPGLETVLAVEMHLDHALVLAAGAGPPLARRGLALEEPAAQFL